MFYPTDDPNAHPSCSLPDSYSLIAFLDLRISAASGSDLASMSWLFIELRSLPLAAPIS
jgi:hypothetical protein